MNTFVLLGILLLFLLFRWAQYARRERNIVSPAKLDDMLLEKLNKGDATHE